MKTENGSDGNSEQQEQEDDDVVLVTPIDDVIVHKPTEKKYDVLSGIIPYETNVIFN